MVRRFIPGREETSQPLTSRRLLFWGGIGCGGVVIVVAAFFLFGGRALFEPKKPPLSGFEKAMVACVRGATASALSASVPVAPLVATGTLAPAGAVYVVAASGVGCGVGAVSVGAAGWMEGVLHWFRSGP
ncbi:membrane hypothetical protein [Azospirillaceae bacterium]